MNKVDNIKDIIELTPSQKGILFDSISTNSNSFIVQIVLDLSGNINFEVLTNSFNKVVNNHDALKSNYIYKGVDDTVRVIYKEKAVSAEMIEVHDTSEIESVIKQDREAGFDIQKENLIRLKLLKLENDNYKILITFHHIIMDGWCKDIILQELFSYYFNDDYHGEKSSDIEYVNYRKRISEDDYKAYWLHYLDGYNCNITIPYKLKNIDAKDHDFKEKYFNKDIEWTNKLKEFSRNAGVTIYSLLTSAWSILLQQLSNSDDVVFGLITSGRNIRLENVNNIVGLFSNVIPIRAKDSKKESIRDLLKNISYDILENEKNDMISLSKINSIVENRNLFDHIVLYENRDNEQWRELFKNTNIKINDEKIIEHTMYSMTLTFEIVNNKLRYHFIYDAKQISEKNIDKLQSILSYIIEQIVCKKCIHVKEINVIDTNSETLNDDSVSNSKTIIEYFQEQVNKVPDNIALELCEKTLTYKELDDYSDKIACLLRERNILNSSIAIYFDRDFDMISSMLAILKTNNYYMPIEYSMPIDRIINNIKGISANILLVNDNSMKKINNEIFKQLTDNNIEILNVNEINSLECCKFSYCGDIENKLAYVMYTSGSTGNPKGVYIYEKSIIRLIKNSNYISINQDDTLLQLSNYAFDGSTFDIYGALLNGAKLVLLPKEYTSDIDKLILAIKESKISIMFITTALFNSLVDYNISCFANLKKVLFGGEIASLTHINKFFDKYGPNKLIHVYGPTENTVFTTFYNVNDIQKDAVPIGKAVSGTQTYILNTYNNIQPDGLYGELYVGGVGVAKGYTDEKISKERFVKINNISDSILYKTGDICYYDDDKNIIFVGRKDGQVKFRGYRIEIGEIQNELLKICGVKQAYVSPVRENNRVVKIQAFLVKEMKDITSEDIKNKLKNVLPSYMIPTQIEFLESLPLNQNGKIDKKFLETINTKKEESIIYESLNDLQQMLIDNVKSILKINNISINDNFYELGGDSIKAIQLVTKLRKANYSLEIKDVLYAKTLDEISGKIKCRSMKNNIARQDKYKGLKDLF